MSASANTKFHIQKPADWQGFERASAILWRYILDDDSIHCFGRSGQAQHGMDMFGYRSHDPSRIVGIQCKCKGFGEEATEKELRADLAKALKFKPQLNEYYFTTTGPDDTKLSQVAAQLVEEQLKLGRKIIIKVWGWGTLEDRINEHPEAALVFDPYHSATAKIQTERHDQGMALQQNNHLAVMSAISALGASIGATDATSGAVNAAEVALDAEIDRYRDRANNDKPQSALDLLQDLLKSLTDKNSGHIWFRVKANIAHCYLKLGDEKAAADMLDEAITHAPDDPKAAANVVLSMMLRGNHNEALDRALVELEKTPDNEALAGYAVQAAGYSGIEDVLSRIPEALRATDAVQKHHLMNLRNAGDPTWGDLARQGRSRDGNDEFYKRQAADADIQSVVEGEHKRTWVLQAEDRPLLRRAANDLISLWTQAKGGEAPYRPDNLALCINATMALIALGEGTEARDLIFDGHKVSQGKDKDLLVRVAAIALEIGDKALAEETFPQLEEDGAALLLRSQIAARYGNWDYLAGIAGTDALETIPETERDVIKALTSSAAIKKLAASDPAAATAQLDRIISDFATSGRASVLIAQTAEELKMKEASATAYRHAVSSITDNSHIASRTMVAGYAARRDDHAAVIELMDGFVDTSADTRELLELASAFAYQFPPKARAVGFFAGLPDAIRNSQKYALLEGIMHYHRGELGLAEERFIKARELTPDQIQPILMQVQTMFRQKRKGDLPALVKNLDPDSLMGSPVDRVNLAQVLAAGGRVDDALHFGFDTLDANRNNPKVSLKWLGLGLGHLKRLHELSDAPIGVGMWTKLVSDDGQINEFLVVDGPGEPAEGKYGATHSIAEAAIGHRVGETFAVRDRLGRTTQWTVQRVQHKYLHAYEDLTENFNTRFPGEDGFFVIRTIDDDIEPFLDIMRRQSESRQKVLDIYSQGPLPIAVIVELSGGDVVRFADSLRINGIKIEACDGTNPERIHAIGLVRKHRGKGVVLDTLTYWALVGMDGLHVLKKVFGNVLLARSTADEISHLEDDDNLVDGGERRGTSYFHGGQFYFDEVTPEREQEIANAIAKREKAMETECEVVPVHAPDDIDPRITEHIHRGALDPIFVARERDMLLVTDDKRFRQWAGSQKVQAVWLQAVFLYAKRNRHINAVEYARLSAELASLGHSTVTCNAGDIIEVVNQVTPETKYTIRAIADVIGVKDADITSHINVVTESIERFWRTGPSLDAQYAISQLMQNLVRHRQSDRDEILAYLRRTLSQLPRGAEYFDRWKVGHFIVDAPAPAWLPVPNIDSNGSASNHPGPITKVKGRRRRKRG
jgi:tetratricopeptide (TPR) repeat protein/predicted nucleic acid-binding protein